MKNRIPTLTQHKLNSTLTVAGTYVVHTKRAKKERKRKKGKEREKRKGKKGSAPRGKDLVARDPPSAEEPQLGRLPLWRRVEGF